MPDRFAAIDVGTNSVLMLVAERRPGGRLRQVLDLSKVTRLGQGLDATGNINPEAAERTLSCIKDFLAQGEKLNIISRVAVGTLCLRNATNADWFIRRAAEELDLRIEIIKGPEEARLTYLGVMQDLPEGSTRPAVFDVGGGSTEIIFGSSSLLNSRQSLEVGASRATEAFLPGDPPSPEALHALLNHLEDVSFRQFEAEAFDSLLGVGGTVTTMAAVELGLEEYDASRVQGLALSRSQVAAQMERFRTANLLERKAIPGLDPARADVILGGVAVIYGLMRRLGADSFTVSARGLRHGLLAERFEPVAG